MKQLHKVKSKITGRLAKGGGATLSQAPPEVEPARNTPRRSQIETNKEGCASQEPPVCKPIPVAADRDERDNHHEGGSIGDRNREEYGTHSEPGFSERRQSITGVNPGTILTSGDDAKEHKRGFYVLEDLLRGVRANCTHNEKSNAIKNRIEVLLSRVAQLDAAFEAPPLGDVPEMRRQSELKIKLEEVGELLRPFGGNEELCANCVQVLLVLLEDLQHQGKLLRLRGDI